MQEQTKICGILGGLGPSATVDLFHEIVRKTPAKTDQEHIHVIINNNPRIPDRTTAMLSGTKEPVPGLVASAKTLEQAGANFIVIPCNTAHYFIPDILKEINIPILDMIELTAAKINQMGYKSVGLISTSATAKMELYDRALAKYNIQVVKPGEVCMAKAMEVIYGPLGVKAGMANEGSEHNKALLLAVINELQAMGAEAVILGCTEIPLTIFDQDVTLPLVNPTQLLAEAIIAESFS